MKRVKRIKIFSRIGCIKIFVYLMWNIEKLYLKLIFLLEELCISEFKFKVLRFFYNVFFWFCVLNVMMF